MSPRLSILILAQKYPNALKSLLSLLLEQQEPDKVEIIVVEDSLSETNSDIESVVRECPDDSIQFYRFTNAGPGLCRNLGADKANGEYLIYLDEQCLIGKQWVKSVLETLDSRKEASILYGPISSSAPSLYPFIHSCVMEDSPVRAINIIFKREAFFSLGGYDPNLSYWAYEWDLAERAQQKNFSMVFVNEIGLEYPPSYRSPEYFNFSKLMRILERSGYLMKKHPKSDEIMQNFLIMKFQWAHFMVRLLPLMLGFFLSPLKTFLIFLLFNLAYDALRLLILQSQLLKFKFSVQNGDAFRYLVWNWSLDAGLFLRQLLLIPYRFC